MGRLDEVDLSLSLGKEEEERGLKEAGKRLAQLRLTLGGLIGERAAGAAAAASSSRAGTPPARAGRSSGWSRRWTRATSASPSSPRPSDDEKRHHFLGRFWPALPGWGGMTVFDRSWYGRVLVERVEGFATRGAVAARLRGDQRLRARRSPTRGRSSSSSGCTSPPRSS